MEYKSMEILPVILNNVNHKTRLLFFGTFYLNILVYITRI